LKRPRAKIMIKIYNYTQYETSHEIVLTAVPNNNRCFNCITK
jgi:hypothetical protein